MKKEKQEKNLIARTKDFFDENDWDLGVVVFGIIAFMLNIAGFSQMFAENNLHGDIWDFVYYSIRVFVFDLQTPALDTPLPLTLEMGRWLSAAVTFLIIVTTIFHVFKTKLILWIYGENHIVIVGAGEKGKTLGLDWLKDNKNKGKKLVFIEKDKNNPNIDTLKDEGAIIIIGQAQDEAVLKKVKAHKAAYFVTLTDSDTSNMEILSTYITLPQKEHKVECYIHIINNEFYDFFSAKGFNAKDSNINIKVFNLYSNSARMLLKEKTLGANVFVDSKSIKDSQTQVKVAIFGFGKLGESILLHILHLGHFYNGTPIKVTVVYDQDKDENVNLEDEFNKQYDVLKEQYNGKYWDVELIDDGDFVNKKMDYTQIIVAYENEFEALSNLMKILKRYNDEILTNNVDVSIYSNSFASTANIIQSDKVEGEHTVFKQVRTFGMLNKTCSYDMVVNQALDKMAEANHNHYEKLHGFVEKGWATPWDDLSIFLQDSNRYLMEHSVIKKLFIKHFIADCKESYDYETTKKSIEKQYFNYKGMQINWDEMGLKNHPYATKLSEENIVTLGKVEHNRWNAFHILNGWKLMPLAELEERVKGLSGHQQKDGKQKDKIKKRHACLVSWDALDRVSEIIEHDYKSDDMETIMRIPSLELACKL